MDPGTWLGRREADLSADQTDVKPGSDTFALRSALLETHLRARGNTRGGGRPQPLVRHWEVTSEVIPARDWSFSRHWITVSCQFRLEEVWELHWLVERDPEPEQSLEDFIFQGTGEGVWHKSLGEIQRLGIS